MKLAEVGGLIRQLLFNGADATRRHTAWLVQCKNEKIKQTSGHFPNEPGANRVSESASATQRVQLDVRRGSLADVAMLVQQVHLVPSPNINTWPTTGK